MVDSGAPRTPDFFRESLGWVYGLGFRVTWQQLTGQKCLYCREDFRPLLLALCLWCGWDWVGKGN